MKRNQRKNGQRPAFSTYALKTSCLIAAKDMAERIGKAATTEAVLEILNHAVDWPIRSEASGIVHDAASARIKALPFDRKAASALIGHYLGAADFSGTLRR